MEDSAVRHFHLVEALKTNDADAVIVALTQLLLAAAKPSPSLVNSKITMPLLPSYGTPLHLAVALSSRPVVEKILSVFCGLGSGAGGSGAGGSGAAGSGAVRAAAVSVGSTNAPRSAPSSNTSSSNTIPSSTPSSSSSSSPQNYHTLGLAWVNAKNNAHGSGETPLHIASRLGRAEIVDLMLRVPSIDDTLRDAEGRVAEEVTKSEKVSELFLVYKSEFIKKSLSTINNHLSSAAPRKVIDFFSQNPRANSYLQCGWIDINAPIDPHTEYGFLHYACKYEQLELLEWSLSKGADPNVKDIKGKKPAELLPKKDSKFKEKLKTASNQATQAPILSASLVQATSSASGVQNLLHAPVMKGNILKWTNYSSGYKSRFFVLESGVLSYYKAEEDYPLACRGSISLLIADIEVPDPNDKSRFDVVGKGSVRYSMKARSFQDAKKWVWALMEAKRWMADRAKEGGVGAAAAHNNNAEDAASHDINNVDEAGGGRDSQDSWDDDLNAVISNSRTASVEFGNNENLGPSHSSTAVAAGGLQLSANQFVIRRSMENLTLSSPNQTGRNSKCAEPISSTDKSVIPILDQESGSTSTHGRAGSRASGSDGIPLIQNSSNTSFQTARGGEEPHLPPVHYHLPSTSTDDFQTLVYLLNVQMDVQQRVIESVVEAISKTNKRSPSSNLITGINNGSPSSSPSTSSSSSTPPLSTSAADINMAELKGMPSLLSSSSSQIFSTIEKIVKLSEARDLKWMKRCKKEREGRLRWEEVVRVVLDGNDVTDATKEKASALALKAASIGGNTTSTTMPPPITSTGLPSTSTSILSPSDDVNHVGLPFSSSAIIGDGEDSEIFYDAPDETRFSIENNRSQFLEQVFGFPSSSSREDRSCLPSSAAVVDASISTTTTQHSTFHAEQPQSSPSPTISSSMLEKSIVGYNPPSKNRSTLPLDPTKPKPSLNAWSFVKSAIGKDLSKVTLPVFFNEPLSMLQRMCEDVEYIELLSLASRAGAGDPTPSTHPAVECAREKGWDLNQVEMLDYDEAGLIRMMLVSAYAMSNYSSTVGRTSKPFNPILGETFELVNSEKQYRYISEQVCHHPPISACYCESPDYSFWTEVYVKSKFWGKSLEIHPLGTCHARVSRRLKDGTVVQEHFSWKKVTTCVNNLIVGKLWIDHYGDMIVKNWQTGQEATITFKPKSVGGWFGWGGGSGGGSASSGSGVSDDGTSGGGEIVGKITDQVGQIRYELKGNWDSDLVAKRLPRLGEDSSKLAPFLTKPICLWKRNSIPQNSTQNFNFTSLAYILNELPADLCKYIPVTDSRKRPDQRAMEEGRWAEANTFKEQLENSQRNLRKLLVKKHQDTKIPDGPTDRRGITIGEEWWIPRWFVREIDQDTQEEHWRFTDDYWKIRNEVVSDPENAKWPDWVRDIFTA